MLYAICFNLYQSKTLSSGNEWMQMWISLKFHSFVVYFTHEMTDYIPCDKNFALTYFQE